MPKRRLTLTLRLPPYRPPRYAWRRKLHREMVAAAERSRVAYARTDRLELRVVLYLHQRELVKHDVDNRLKDIMDALQGRVGGPKGESRAAGLIPNDSQIYRVSVEKMLSPGQSHGLGHLVLGKHRNHQ